MTATTVQWLLGASTVAYVVGGIVGFGLWMRQLVQLRRTEPYGWPLLLPPRMQFAYQAWVLGGIPLATLGILFMTPVLRSKAAPVWILGGAIALVGSGALFAAQDVWAMRRSRRTARQQARARLTDAAPPP